ncbi:MAG: hypothetical protein Q9186_006268, partial [Xanthomendoza sp. 1 TL-2023]
DSIRGIAPTADVQSSICKLLHYVALYLIRSVAYPTDETEALIDPVRDPERINGGEFRDDVKYATELNDIEGRMRSTNVLADSLRAIIKCPDIQSNRKAKCVDDVNRGLIDRTQNDRLRYGCDRAETQEFPD